MSKQPEALRLADALYSNDPQGLLSQAAAELRRLHEENQRLKTVMIAAAAEIAAHWDAHCDAEGYGPANLMHRLERGIASEYNYTAGSFARLHEVNQELLEALLRIMRHVPTDFGGASFSDDWWKAQRIIAKATGGQQ